MLAETIGLIDHIPPEVLGYSSQLCLIDDICATGLHVIFITLLSEKRAITQKSFIIWKSRKKHPPGGLSAQAAGPYGPQAGPFRPSRFIHPAFCSHVRRHFHLKKNNLIHVRVNISARKPPRLDFFL